jgi:Zn-dependent protease with chaperone function
MFEYDYTKLKLLLASGMTLVLLVIFLSIPLIVASFLSNKFSFFSLVFTLCFSLGFNIILFFLSPLLINLLLNSQYKNMNWTALHSIQDTYPISHSCIQTICKKYRIPKPRIAIVSDINPFAFTYGNFPCNARIVISRGLLSFLRDEEIAAVCAHELGHIIRHDVALMTLAQTIVACFYWLAQVLIRSNSGSSALSRLKIRVDNFRIPYSAGFLKDIHPKIKI